MPPANISKYVDVDVSIEIDELAEIITNFTHEELATIGVSVDQGGTGTFPHKELEDFHSEEHEGPLRFCANKLCAGLNSHVTPRN